MKIGKTNAIFGGGVVYNFVPFVAPERFDDPRKYNIYGCTVNLYEKFRIYKMTWAGADIAVEFSDAIDSTTIPAGSTFEVFETVSGVETSILYAAGGAHEFTSGSTKRYMIRRASVSIAFVFPFGSVWAYCFGITSATGYISPENPYLKYVFFYENTLTSINSFRNTAITGVLTINGGVTIIQTATFKLCTNLTKVITGDTVTAINGNRDLGAFQECTSLEVADLGTGMSQIGFGTFSGCTSLASIICRAYNPPTLLSGAFSYIPDETNIYVPHERVDAYKDATNWIAFASRIFSINDL